MEGVTAGRKESEHQTQLVSKVEAFRSPGQCYSSRELSYCLLYMANP